MRLSVGSGCWLRLGRHPDLEEQAAALEPWTLAVSGALREPRSPGTRFVACVEDRRGSLLGAVVFERVAANRWNALPMVLDVRAARPVAWLVDRSPARRVFGMPDHVRPLLAHLGRLTTVGRMPFYVTTLEDAVRPDVDDRTRVAGRGDVPAVQAVFEGYPYLQLPSRRATRRFLEHAVDHRYVVVVEVEGRVAGAVLAEALGRDTIYMADMAVHPDFRGQGLSWPMIFRFADLAIERGLALCGTKDDSNPMDAAAYIVAHEAGDGEPVDEWLAARLRPHRLLGPPKWRDRQVRRVHRRLAAVEQRAGGLRRPPHGA